MLLRVDGLRDAIGMLDDVGERARRPEPALRARETLEDLHAAERRRWARRWKPISRDWAERKRRQGLDPRVMRATGALHDALTRGEGPPRVTFRAWDGVLSWGVAARSPVWYAAVQKKRGRNAVVIDVEARRRIASRVAVYIAEGRVTQ